MTSIVDTGMTLEDLMAKHPIMRSVLERFGFDCEKQAAEDIKTAATEKGIDLDLLRLVLEAVIRTPRERGDGKTEGKE